MTEEPREKQTKATGTKRRPIQHLCLLFLLVYVITYFIVRDMSYNANNPMAQVYVRIKTPRMLVVINKIYLPLCKLEALIRYGSTDMFVETSDRAINLY